MDPKLPRQGAVVGRRPPELPDTEKVYDGNAVVGKVARLLLQPFADGVGREDEIVEQLKSAERSLSGEAGPEVLQRPRLLCPLEEGSKGSTRNQRIRIIQVGPLQADVCKQAVHLVAQPLEGIDKRTELHDRSRRLLPDLALLQDQWKAAYAIYNIDTPAMPSCPSGE